jgi:hypothetical protein
MKTNIYFFVFVISLLCFDYKTFAQNKIGISTGIGLPELLNIGISYQFDEIQIGLTAGTIPKDNVTSVFIYTQFHFEKLTDSSEISPWYLMYGLNYLRDETKSKINKYFHGNFRIGREIYLTKNIVFDFNIGMVIKIAEKTFWKENNNYPLGGTDFPTFFPSLGINTFYKF